MRGQTAVFVIGNKEDVETIRSVLIPEKIEGYKYMSRLGLFCTADSPLMEITKESGIVSEVEDLYTISESGDDRDRLVLTDGAGWISRVGYRVWQAGKVCILRSG